MILAILISVLSFIPLQENEKGISTFDKIQSDSLTVYVFLLDECLISQFYTLELSRLSETYKSKGVGFIGYFPNSASSTQDIQTFGKAYHLDFPLEQDYNKALTQKFEITVTPEVAVWDHRSDRLIYRGRIDDSYVRVGKRKLHPKNHDLEDIISSWLVGKTTEQLIETQAIGCFINFDSPKQ